MPRPISGLVSVFKPRAGGRLETLMAMTMPHLIGRNRIVTGGDRASVYRLGACIASAMALALPVSSSESRCGVAQYHSLDATDQVFAYPVERRKVEQGVRIHRALNQPRDDEPVPGSRAEKSCTGLEPLVILWSNRFAASEPLSLVGGSRVSPHWSFTDATGEPLWSIGLQTLVNLCFHAP